MYVCMCVQGVWLASGPLCYHPLQLQQDRQAGCRLLRCVGTGIVYTAYTYVPYYSTYIYERYVIDI